MPSTNNAENFPSGDQKCKSNGKNESVDCYGNFFWLFVSVCVDRNMQTSEYFLGLVG